MSFRHKFPSTVVCIGYVEGAVNIGRSKSSGIRVRAKIYNKSETYRQYDLRIPVIAFGTPAKMLLDADKTGELVTVVGRLAMVKNDTSTNMEVLVDHIKSLDEDDTDGMDKGNV